jgi:hypothetical protein
MPAFVQGLAVGRTQHRPATGRKHAAGQRGQLIDHRFLDIAKARLPFPLKVVTDGATQPLLDDMVGVEKGQLQASGELTPDCGFTGAGEAYEANGQGILIKNVVCKPEGTVILKTTESPARQSLSVTEPEVAISAAGSVPGGTLTTGVPYT